LVRIGVIGYGYWGPNLVRNFVECPETEVVGVADLNPDRLGLIGRRYPAVQTTTDYAELLRNPHIDAIAISTPVTSHFPLAMEALKAGKHVLVEKPMTVNSEQAMRLIEEAERRKLVLMVDHTFVYTAAVRKIRDLIDRGSLGQIYYYDSTRVNLGLFQHDVDVIWDLAVHDLSIMEYILPESPVAVSATGISHVAGAAENIAYVTAFYESSLIAHLNVNWLSPVKVRRTLIGGSRKMVVYDDTESSEKVKLYDKGITVKNGPESVYKLLVGYRSGDMYCPQLDVTEGLRVEAQHFADCVENGKTPLTDGYAGLRVVSVLEAATESMKNRGLSVPLAPSTMRRPACA
jgi:predicted dehydrogenase